MEEILLHHGLMTTSLRVDLGGSIATLRYANRDILRPWDGTPSVRKMASYPLIPYSNRMANGVLPVEGTTHQLNLNFGDHPHSIHGVGWQQPWRVEEVGQDFCRLSFEHKAIDRAAQDWPFSFSAQQHIRLTDNELIMQQSITNTGAQPMPFGLGWHPFFQQSPSCTLRFESEFVWLNGENALPEQRIDCDSNFAFSQAKPLKGVVIDNCFEGWRGLATLEHPEWGLEVAIHSPDLRYLVVFSPAHSDEFIAIEPVSHLNNAAHQADPQSHGWRILPAGLTQSFDTRVTIQSLKSGSN
jgi:aldose 1-epimerase